MRRSRCFAAAFLALLLTAACREQDRGDHKLLVYTSIPPLGYLVEQIGDGHATVETLIQPAQDPHTFEPTPRQVTSLSRAQIYFTVGLPFETRLIPKIRGGLTDLAIRDTTERTDHDTSGRLNGHGDNIQEHAHDPHVWLSPHWLKRIAQNIAAGLGEADPEHAEEYQRNLKALQTRIDTVDERLRQMLAPFEGRSFYVLHGAFDHFAEAYGLNQQAIEHKGKSPGPQQVRAIIENAKQEHATHLFVQPQFDRKSAKVIADAIGASLETLDPLASNVPANLEDIAIKIVAAFKEADAGAQAPKHAAEKH